VKTRRLLAAVLVAATLVVGGCSRPPAKGKVYEKHFEPAYVWTSSTCISYTKKGWCRLYLPQTHPVAEKWIVTLDDGRGNQWDVDVDAHTYADLQIGDTLRTRADDMAA
jgi:hypothetical protein